MSNLSPLVNQLKSKVPARLMPTLANSKAEERATSCLLASLMVVPGFAQAVLKKAGAPLGKRFRSQCFTEVVFAEEASEKSCRPDGLIIATNGSTTWTALIESKVGNNTIDSDQVERYLDLAKKYGINSVITISNQYAPSDTVLPYDVKPAKLKKVECCHYSWHSLLTTAILVAADKETDDVEQSFILDDLVNFLDHPSSGISALTSLHKDWRELCEDIHAKKPINKSLKIVNNAVNSWLQLMRASAINLSKEVHQPVEIYLNSQLKKEPQKLLDSLVDDVCSDHVLDAEFVIPYAAGRVKVSADLTRRSLEASMKVDAPTDVSRQTAAINWLTRQLKSVSVDGVIVRAYWPKRLGMTAVDLSKLFDKPELLVPQGKDLPKHFEVVMSLDMQGRFKQTKVIVEETNKLLLSFYSEIGQNLSKWVPKAPKVSKRKDTIETIKHSPSAELMESHTELVSARKVSNVGIPLEASSALSEADSLHESELTEELDSIR